MQGMIRGLGKFKAATWSLMLSLYCVCLPLGYLFGLHWDMGLPGLWLGMLIGLVLLTSFYLFLTLYKFDWNAIADGVYERS